mmetsp:Transcript_22898/g.26102  ORF Transcript_22898/g.26102 Transcript_22898/m.26102 type:complete len:162 (-) Transcript_22898:71-556(-)|eukprot:CAMPEP_0194145360 /NCGR_PEP_ID=MMETSP0152-20130528/17129_1 /TAXON_ID=1049557 /ORGANISM="Thalassiothrix antarctica, Strain L6-D1" /LENGTH=161 /DNA_ID=CAMNT_0038845575 /DNA_START=165 /DNA_END=650 /DNA_ORIENTATION=+
MAGKAVCILASDASLSGSGGVYGVITLTQSHDSEPTTIKGEIKGLTPNTLHGISLNTYGDLSDFATSTGEPFNPFNGSHGLPGDPSRRVGSLGNVKAGEDGKATVDITDKLVQLLGPHSVIGRSIVICSSQDDGGRGGSLLSSDTGNSGPRIAAGVIGMSA